MIRTAWRVVKTKYATSAFDGYGALVNGGRWNSVGLSAVYLAESPALAVLEIMAHLDKSALIPAFTIFEVRFDEKYVTEVASEDLPAKWFKVPRHKGCEAIGDVWLRAGTTPLLHVPSVLLLVDGIPQHSNYILSPNHPKRSELKIGPPLPLNIDSRLIKRG